MLEIVKRCGVAGLPFNLNFDTRSYLEKYTSEGDSPVGEIEEDVEVS